MFFKIGQFYLTWPVSAEHMLQSHVCRFSACCSPTPGLSNVYSNLGELGDCDPLEHSPELVSEFRFSPKQSEAMEADIFGRWLELR